MIDRKFKLMIARFPGNASEHPASTTWVMETMAKMLKDPSIELHHMWWKSDTPITMVRNACIRDAVKLGVDAILMIDSDMKPDHDHSLIPSPAPFWETSWEFFKRHYQQGPCIIGAPYCGPPPHENIYVFEWKTVRSDDPDEGHHFKLDQYTREQASKMGGIKECAALPTGLILIDMRLFTGFMDPVTGKSIALAKPYFYYEWTDEWASNKASTEDVTFTRDASMLGVKCYCNWDAWALHIKHKEVGRPHTIDPCFVSNAFRQAMGLPTTDRGVNASP